jgi:hypothetical protein
MTRVVRNAALAIAGILVASAALANVPDPAHCTLTNKDIASVGKNAYIAVVGQNNAGLADPCEAGGRCGDYQVTIKDFANNVIAGSTVVIDFSGCSDVQISCDQLNASTGQTDLAGKKVAGTTNASGQFTFKIQGASNSTSTQGPNFLSAGNNAGVPCAQVYADGVPIGNLTPASYDVNGLGSTVSAAVNSADVAKVKIEALINGLGNRSRSDYNYDNVVNAGDVGISQAIALTSAANGTIKTTPFADGHYCP